MNGIIRVALYARVSSQRQAEEKTIDSQCQAIQARIRKDCLTIAEDNVYCDEGYSGAELFRPALEQLRDRIAASLIDRLYVHSPDRLSRKMAHHALLLEEFCKHGCEVIFLNQEGLPSSPEANLLIQMQGMIAEYEREKILERTRRGRRHSASQGNVSVFSGAPYGYRYVSKSTAQGRASWEIDPIECEHVRLMFELVDQRGFSLSQVQRELASQGIRTKTGKRQWDRATIRGILLNPAYYGQARYGKERLVPRKPGKRAKRGDPAIPRQVKVAVSSAESEQIVIAVPAIINEALFQRVGKIMQENRRQQRQRQAGPKYLLSGMLVCGQCGSAYCSRRQGGGRYLYYRCIGTDKYRHEGQAICNNPSVQGVELEKVVWSELCNLLKDPRRLREELSRRRKEETSSDSQLESRQRQVNELRGRIDRLIDAYTAGFLEKNEFESRIVPLRENHDREVSALASLRGELHDAIDVASAEKALTQLTESVDEELATADDQVKRQLLELLVKRIEIHPNEIRIVYKVPQRPFVLNPGDRGFLQHCLRRPEAASRLERKFQNSTFSFSPSAMLIGWDFNTLPWKSTSCNV